MFVFTGHLVVLLESSQLLPQLLYFDGHTVLLGFLAVSVLPNISDASLTMMDVIAYSGLSASPLAVLCMILHTSLSYCYNSLLSVAGSHLICYENTMYGVWGAGS